MRWPVEEDFEFGKDCFGLDQSQVRLYTAIARHTVLVMAALAICAVTAALLRRRTDTQAPAPAWPDQAPPADPGMIPLTVPETGRLLGRPPPPAAAGHWLDWRRRTRPAHAGTTSGHGSPATPRSPWSAGPAAAVAFLPTASLPGPGRASRRKGSDAPATCRADFGGCLHWRGQRATGPVAWARFLERNAATLIRPLQRSEHQRRDRFRDSSTKTLVQPAAAQIFSRSA